MASVPVSLTLSCQICPYLYHYQICPDFSPETTPHPSEHAAFTVHTCAQALGPCRSRPSKALKHVLRLIWGGQPKFISQIHSLALGLVAHKSVSWHRAKLPAFGNKACQGLHECPDSTEAVGALSVKLFVFQTFPSRASLSLFHQILHPSCLCSPAAYHRGYQDDLASWLAGCSDWHVL